MTNKTNVIIKSGELLKKYDNILQKELFSAGNRLKTTTDKEMQMYKRYKYVTGGYLLENEHYFRNEDLTEEEYKAVYKEQLKVEKQLERWFDIIRSR